MIKKYLLLDVFSVIIKNDEEIYCKDSVGI